MLIKIGEAAAHYEISNRSLRYWEEAGILQSTRMENGYRYYNEGNLMKIKQIVFLRKLRLPLQEIAEILLSDECSVAVSILERHAEEIQLEASALRDLGVVLDELLKKLKDNSSLSDAALVLQNKNPTGLTLQAALKSTLAERKVIMANSMDTFVDVRIVTLPKMYFVTYCAQSSTPEDDCNKVIEKFIEKHNLREVPGFRRFGSNNPNPKEGSAVYGYEMWAVIPEEMSVEPPYQKYTFPGGTFASIPCRLSTIGERWRLLSKWVKESIDYEYCKIPGFHLCGLEEELNPFTKDKGEDFQMDLLVPIKKKGANT